MQSSLLNSENIRNIKNINNSKRLGINYTANLVYNEPGYPEITCPLSFIDPIQFDFTENGRHLTLAQTQKDEMDNNKIQKHNNALQIILASNFPDSKFNAPRVPDNLVEMRNSEIQKRNTDPEYIPLALEYLHHVHNMYPYRDFVYETAIQFANEQAFLFKIPKIPTSQVIRLPGCAPSTWDGISKCDSRGHYVEWKPAEDHYFLTPHIIPVNKNN